MNDLSILETINLLMQYTRQFQQLQIIRICKRMLEEKILVKSADLPIIRSKK